MPRSIGHGGALSVLLGNCVRFVLAEVLSLFVVAPKVQRAEQMEQDSIVVVHLEGVVAVFIAETLRLKATEAFTYGHVGAGALVCGA